MRTEPVDLLKSRHFPKPWLNAQDHVGQTPLMLAAARMANGESMTGGWAKVEALLMHGADPCIPDAQGADAAQCLELAQALSFNGLGEEEAKVRAMQRLRSCLAHRQAQGLDKATAEVGRTKAPGRL